MNRGIRPNLTLISTFLIMRGRISSRRAAANEGAGPTEAELRRIEALYLGEVTFVDKWVGALLDKVDALNLRDDTIVVLMSDHGTQLRDHGSFGKGANKLHPFNTQLNLMIRHPNGASDKDISAFVQNHDLMPTLLNQLGIPCDWTDGEDMWPLVTQEKAFLRERIITGWAGFVTGNARGRVSVRDNRWNFAPPSAIAMKKATSYLTFGKTRGRKSTSRVSIHRLLRSVAEMWRH